MNTTTTSLEIVRASSCVDVLAFITDDGGILCGGCAVAAGYDWPVLDDDAADLGTGPGGGCDIMRADVETDTPIHCDTCRALLAFPLTNDGRRYVTDALNDNDGDADVLAAWRAEYGNECGPTCDECGDIIGPDACDGWTDDVWVLCGHCCAPAYGIVAEDGPARVTPFGGRLTRTIDAGGRLTDDAGRYGYNAPLTGAYVCYECGHVCECDETDDTTPTPEDVAAFIDYVCEWYEIGNPDALDPIATRAEITAAVLRHVANPPFPFEGDTADRETVRGIIEGVTA
jgi:hypothetical protein